MQRAYSVLTIKSVSEDDRVIEGMATTPTPDRMGDIVEPLGARFAIPMPLLWQHMSDQPIGQVEFAKPTKDGIPFRARLVSPDAVESATLKDRLQLAWDSIKTNLVRAVSIGFRAVEYSFMDDGGIRFLEWEWLELSAVTIPANADCGIDTIRSIDSQQRAASGRELRDDADRPTRPAAVGRTKGVSALNLITPKEGGPMKTIAEQIAAFEATRAAKQAALEAIQAKAADENRTKDAAEREEFNTLRDDIKAIDDELADLREMEKTIKAAATPAKGQSQAEGVQARGAVVEVIGGVVPKGTAFTRYAIALARSRGNLMQALEVAKANEDWSKQTPEVELVLRSAVAAGTTTDSTWAAPLVPYTQMASEFIELLRPATILGRFGQNGIPGLRKVPFNISMPRQTAGASVGWVGEGKAKPLTKGAFDTVTLRWAKAAGIVVLTDELIRFSNPAAEGVVRQDLIDGMAQFLDQQLVDPDVSAVADVSPASLTNGVASIPSTGTTADALRDDIGSLFAAMIAAGISPSGCVFIMSELEAMRIGMLRNALGNKEFPDITVNGGILEGVPVITSQNDGIIDGGSPVGNRIILVKASEVFLADDGQVVLDASREASLQMDSSPDEPTAASTVLVNLWQRNMTALKAERWINWQRRRTGAVQWISDAHYG